MEGDPLVCVCFTVQETAEESKDPESLITVTGGTHSVPVCVYVGVCKGICTSSCSGAVGLGGLAHPAGDTGHAEPATG